jgi:predicted nucleotidyltransferase
MVGVAAAGAAAVVEDNLFEHGNYDYDKRELMNMTIDLSTTALLPAEQTAVTAFCKSIQEALGDALVSITLYGSATREDYQSGISDINVLVVTKYLDLALMKKVLDPVAISRQYAIAPFFLTVMNLRSSTDIFPIKFFVMKESYRVLEGQDVLCDSDIRREDLRLRCEQETMNLLLRLRRYYILHSGRLLTDMMSRMIKSLIDILYVLVWLKQGSTVPREQVIEVAAKIFDLDAEILRNVAALRATEASLSAADAEHLYDRFMTVVSGIAEQVDQME